MRDPNENISDCTLREKFSIPSIDFVIMKKRLLYVRRMLLNPHPTLCAMLSVEVKGRRLPWIRQLNADLEMIRERVIPGMPPADIACCKWTDLIKSSMWFEVVEAAVFRCSQLDPTVAPDAPVILAFCCRLCTHHPAFASSRALQTHMRAKHGSRSPVQRFVPSSVCPVCKTDFVHRLRCLGHLADKRLKCREILLAGGFPPVPEEALEQLRLQDLEARRLAYRAGRSHVIATRPATRPDGTVVGKVSAHCRPD